MSHRANFLECVKRRQRPTSDIEIGFRATATCLLANVSLRSGMQIGWDEAHGTATEKKAHAYLRRDYRKPWKLEVQAAPWSPSRLASKTSVAHPRL